jgi:hypothetical protein
MVGYQGNQTIAVMNNENEFPLLVVLQKHKLVESTESKPQSGIHENVRRQKKKEGV